MRYRFSVAFLVLIGLLVWVLLPVTPVEPDNWQYCSILDGSKFDRTPTNVDRQARTYADYVTSKANVNQNSLKRLVCYTLAFLPSYTRSRFQLKAVNVDLWFPELSFKSATKPSNKHYGIVYAFIVHQNLPALIELTQLLNDTFVLFVFHVDLKHPEMKLAVSSYFAASPNAIVIQKSYPIQWGHISIVFAQLECFFQAYHRVSFDYIINMSVDHYPLYNSQVIYEYLKKHGQKSHFFLRKQLDENRLQYPLLSIGDSLIKFKLERGWPFNFPAQKHDQWMILSHEYISRLFLPESIMFLAYVEHVMVPDELFFASLPTVKDLILDTRPTFAFFLGDNPHPELISNHHALIGVSKTTLFVRKVHNTKMKQWLTKHMSTSTIVDLNQDMITE